MIYLVLGMHKSGTTLISQILHESGINMGDFNANITYDQGNKYERESTKQLNKAILNCGDAISISVNNIIPSDKISLEYHKKGKEIVNQLNNTFINWGFKDPRSCLLCNFWISLLNPCKVIFVFRDPKSIYKRYTNYFKAKSRKKAFEVGWEALRSWYLYNATVLNSCQSLVAQENFLILKYDQLLHNNEREHLRLETFLEQPLKNVIDTSLYRNQPKSSIGYQICLKLSQYFHQTNINDLYNKINQVYNEQLNIESV